MIVDLFTMILAKISEPSIQPPFRRIRDSPTPRIAPPKTTAIKCSVFSSKGFFKVGKTYCVDNKAHERFCKEILTDKNDTPAMRNGRNTSSTHNDRLYPVSLLMIMAIPAVPYRWHHWEAKYRQQKNWPGSLPQ